MQARQLSSRWRAAVLLAVGMLALFALAACGSDDEDAPAASAPPTQTPAPTATLAPSPPAAAVVPATAPAPGSDEAQILAVLEKQARAINARDWAFFLALCTPNKEHLSEAQLKSCFESWGVFGPYVPDFSYEGYNARNVKFRWYGEDTATTMTDVFDYDSFVAGDISRTWERVGGVWYSNDACDRGRF